jgi:hypothetical protein
MKKNSPYEKGWKEYTDKYSQIIHDDPTVGSNIVDFLFSGQPNSDYFTDATCQTIICGHKLPFQINASCASYLWEKIKSFEIRNFVESNMNQKIDWIVELGSGPSYNLFKLWESFGPKDAHYIGAEYTDSGIELSNLLHKHFNGMNFVSTHFDYYNMQLEKFIPKGNGLIFSSYSIEQIKFLNPDFFDQIIEIPGLISVLHIEPVGWQFYELNFMDQGNYQHDEYLLHKQESLSAEYNENFATLFKDALERNIIEMDCKNLKLNFLSHRIDLPGTIVSWSPKR